MRPPGCQNGPHLAVIQTGEIDHCRREELQPARTDGMDEQRRRQLQPLAKMLHQRRQFR